MQKTAIVTGASRGFGRGIASVLSMEGEYKVFATARNKAALDGLKTSQRKCLFAAFKKPLHKEMKVAQFGGYVSEILSLIHI